MAENNRRMHRERKTVKAMIALYCHDRHNTQNEVCPECKALLDYAMRRLDKCPFQEGKTICANCRVHCYKPDMREKIREIMRYAGPRMTYRHPLLAMMHLFDGKRNKPVRHNTRKSK